MHDIQRYILNEFEPSELSDSINIAQNLTKTFKFTHVPVVKEGVFLGNLIADDIENASDDDIVKDLSYALESFYAINTTNWFDVLQVFSKYETNIVPVIDQQNKYIGYYDLNDIIKTFSETPFLYEDGNTIIVEKGITEYSMSEITQIIESNNTKVLGLFINNIKGNIIQITIKISPQNMSAILQTFRRYEYEIVSEHLDDTYLNNLKNRSDYLDKFLNI